jgi:ribonuclease HI
LGNPGPGGYGSVLLFPDRREELSGGYSRTTNNRMEIMAVIVALEALPEPSKVALFSDSQYVINTMTKGWAVTWKKNGWKKADKQPAVNPDLWEQMLALAARHQIEFRWVRGHSGDIENERCDYLATSAAAQPNLPPDPGYLGAATTSRPTLRPWVQRRARGF